MPRWRREDLGSTRVGMDLLRMHMDCDNLTFSSVHYTITTIILESNAMAARSNLLTFEASLRYSPLNSTRKKIGTEGCLYSQAIAMLCIEIPPYSRS